MKFPGRRKTKHYFPITDKGRLSINEKIINDNDVYVVGIDQLLVDIEIEVSDEFLLSYNFEKGQSFIIDDSLCEEVYQVCKEQNCIRGEYPGGAIGNTLHNYSILSESRSYALGCINRNIVVGDYAFGYLSKTSGLVDMQHLMPADKSMGRALCFITPDMERTFAISKGCMNEYCAEYLPEKVIANASALLISAYTLRSEIEPIFTATHRACEIAKENNVPVIMSLGTSSLVESNPDFFTNFAKKYVTGLAMNSDEAFALTKIEDSLLSCEKLLDSVDFVLLTVGAKGLYLAGHVDEEVARESNEPLVTKSIVNYNEFEYSRLMRKRDCDLPKKIYTHISPYNGGPLRIKNTNGAGDAALSTILHDLAANNHHKMEIPNSPKHDKTYLTYSSISQIGKYASRVSFEVLNQNSPRLYKALPEREDVLEESFWSK